MLGDEEQNSSGQNGAENRKSVGNTLHNAGSFQIDLKQLIMTKKLYRDKIMVDSDLTSSINQGLKLGIKNGSLAQKKNNISRISYMSGRTIEIKWHGRGGQGAITAAKIVANAAFESGYKGVIMAPSFGTERRGAPVNTSLKISKTKINNLSPIENPDIVVVLDHLILDEVDVTDGLKPGGLLVLNTPKSVDDYQFDNVQVVVADVTRVSSEVKLKKGVVNSGIIGALAKATDLVDLEVLLKAIEKEFQGRKPKENAESAKVTYERTVMGVK